MQVTLPPALDRMVEEKVAAGLYESPSEVVREALRLLFDRESALEWLRREAALGFKRLDAGGFLTNVQKRGFRNRDAMDATSNWTFLWVYGSTPLKASLHRNWFI